MILVTGATGRVGYPLLEALADKRADVTAMVRVEARAADLPGAPRHVVATFDDPPPGSVLRQFDRIFLLSPEHEEQAALETVFVDAIAAAGHRPHVVKICCNGFQDPDTDVRFTRAHRRVAAHLDAAGLPVTYLACAVYMDNLLAAAVFAREVDYADQPPEEARKAMLADGLVPWDADGNLERFEWIRQGGAATVTRAVRELTGTGPRPLDDWLSESRASFG